MTYSVQVDAAVPQWMLEKFPKEQWRHTQPREKPISIGDLRLVTALEDSETGIKRDVIVKVVKPCFVKSDKGGRVMERQIFGTDIMIPWPKEKRDKIEEYPSDTPAEKVRERTFVPTLSIIDGVIGGCPIVPSVIDELRNKYSKFRTRHTPEYIEMKEEEERAKEERRQLTKLMRSPRQIAAEAAREERKKEKGESVLSEEMLEKIGKVVVEQNGLKFEESEIYQQWRENLLSNETGEATSPDSAPIETLSLPRPGPAEDYQVDIEEHEPAEETRKSNIL